MLAYYVDAAFRYFADALLFSLSMADFLFSFFADAADMLLLLIHDIFARYCLPLR